MAQQDFAPEFMKMMRWIHGTVLPKSISNGKSSITPLQLDAMLYLNTHPKSAVSALGHYLNLSSSSVAQLTDRLAESGFIKRGNNPNDRRSVVLSLTPRGNAVFSKLHKVHAGKMEELITFMPERDVKELARIFRGLHKKLGDRKNA